MSREIKFRGKDAFRGQWVYGYLAMLDETSWGLLGKIYRHEEEEITTSVDGNTIGQFTGLFDANKKPIYEGDIICDEFNNLHLIRYSDDTASFTATLAQYVGNKYAERGMTPGIEQRWIDEFKKVVVGNIHDNPEMLKGGER